MEHLIAGYWRRNADRLYMDYRARRPMGSANIKEFKEGDRVCLKYDSTMEGVIVPWRSNPQRAKYEALPDGVGFDAAKRAPPGCLTVDWSGSRDPEYGPFLWDEALAHLPPVALNKETAAQHFADVISQLNAKLSEAGIRIKEVTLHSWGRSKMGLPRGCGIITAAGMVGVTDEKG